MKSCAASDVLPRRAKEVIGCRCVSQFYGGFVWNLRIVCFLASVIYEEKGFVAWRRGLLRLVGSPVGICLLLRTTVAGKEKSTVSLAVWSAQLESDLGRVHEDLLGYTILSA